MSTNVGPRITEVIHGSKPDGLGCLDWPRERTSFLHTRSVFHPLPVHPPAIVSLLAPVLNPYHPKDPRVCQGV
jgi:hypothetical protein